MRLIKFVVFLSLIVSQVLAHADQAKDLRITASPWSPYVSRNHPGNGVAVSIVTTVLQRAGYTSSFALLQWPDDLESTRLGVYDMIASMSCKGNCWDNSPVGRFFSSLKREWTGD